MTSQGKCLTIEEGLKKLLALCPVITPTNYSFPCAITAEEKKKNKKIIIIIKASLRVFEMKSKRNSICLKKRLTVIGEGTNLLEIQEKQKSIFGITNSIDFTSSKMIL